MLACFAGIAAVSTTNATGRMLICAQVIKLLNILLSLVQQDLPHTKIGGKFWGPVSGLRRQHNTMSETAGLCNFVTVRLDKRVHGR